MFKAFLFAIILLISVAVPNYSLAAENYPKIANYYLNFFTPQQYEALAKYDLLILQPEMGISQAKFWTQYRKAKPDGKILAYLYPAAFYRESLFYDQLGVRNQLFAKISCNDWWLRDVGGDIISPWPRMNAINLTKSEWREANLNHLLKSYDLAKRWDGVMWDLVDSLPSRYSTEPIDVNETKMCAPQAEVDAKWQVAMTQFLALARVKLPKKIMLINGDSLPLWQSRINGRMFEHFPTPWEGDGGWQASMKQYLSVLPALNQTPKVYVINARYDNNKAESIYQQLRFSLASSLLGDGYLSFDGGAESHSQLWWFDEYDVKLGKALTSATNLTGSTALVAPGLWWREFEKGAVLVNSSLETQRITLPMGKYRRLKGIQDKMVNNGQRVVDLELAPQDGLILLKN